MKTVKGVRCACPVRVSDGYSRKESRGGIVVSWNLSSSNSLEQDTWKLLLPLPPHRSCFFFQIQEGGEKPINSLWMWRGMAWSPSQWISKSLSGVQTKLSWGRGVMRSFLDFHFGGPYTLRGLLLTHCPSSQASFFLLLLPFEILWVKAMVR